MKDEPVFETRLHYIILAWPISLLVVGCILLSLLPDFKMIALMIMGVGLLAGLMLYSALTFSSFVIYPKSIAIQSGIYARQSVSLPIAKIETVEVRQTILGALLNYGTVILVGTGGTRNVFNNIAQPLTCRRHIERLVNNA